MEKIRHFFNTLWKYICFPFVWVFTKVWNLVRKLLVRLLGDKYLSAEAKTAAFWHDRIRNPYYSFKEKHPWPGRIVSVVGKIGLAGLIYFSFSKPTSFTSPGKCPAPKSWPTRIWQ